MSNLLFKNKVCGQKRPSKVGNAETVTHILITSSKIRIQVDSSPRSEVTPSHYWVDTYTSSWSPKGQGHCSMSIGPLFPEIRLFQNLTLKIQGQGLGQDQTQRSYLRPRIQLICLLFIS